MEIEDFYFDDELNQDIDENNHMQLNSSSQHRSPKQLHSGARKSSFVNIPQQITGDYCKQVLSYKIIGDHEK